MVRRRGTRQERAPKRLILDSGAVIALARLDVRVRAIVVRAREAGVEVSIPAVVIATAVGLGGAIVLTGDPGDLGPLADRHPEVVISSL